MQLFRALGRFSTFKELNFSEGAMQRINKLNPKAEEHLSDFVNLMRSRLNFEERHFKSMIFREPTIVNSKDIKTNLDVIQSIGVEGEDLRNILTVYPKVLQNTQKNLEQISRIIADYVGLPIGPLLVKYPYLLNMNSERVIQNLKYLYHLGFSQKQIQKQVQYAVEHLDWKPSFFKTLISHYLGLITQEQLIPLLDANPQLLLLDAHMMVGTKINMFRKLGLTDQQMGQILLLVPKAFYRSVSSLDLIIRFFEKKLKTKIQDHPSFPKILNYDYWYEIRPRQFIILKRLTIAEDSTDYIQLMEMSQEEFINKYNCQDRYVDLRNQKPNNHKEVDFVRRSFHKRVNQISLLQ